MDAVVQDLRELTLSDEETAAFEQDYDTEMQLAVDSIHQQLDTEEAGKRHSYNTPITVPIDVYEGTIENNKRALQAPPAPKSGPPTKKGARQSLQSKKEALREGRRMSIHLKDITKAAQNEPKSATVESGGAGETTFTKVLKTRGSYI
ncbi:hypothetical protein NDU88_005016 [Pleurodeles waltl]|uniref:Uncharacterized protein n=1 Tax=Pleurodeles waltl TaxID=8319 RepID=A0AAV7TAF0_PLEWA|nr:hypothetical protein NDU88_005016 [Pleurodeles waltl]